MTLDLCCPICENRQYGVCLTAYGCDHHKLAQAQDEADARARTTVRRPTEDQAIRNVMRARNPKRRARARVYPKEET